MAKKIGDVLETIAKSAVQTIELRFAAENGTPRSAALAVGRLDAAALFEGIALEPGIVLLPDAESAYLDPFRDTPTLVLFCDVLDRTGDDPRRLAKRAEARLVTSGLADSAQFGCELRYYVFDAVAYENAPDASGYRLELGAASDLEEVRAGVLAALHAAGVDVGLQRALAFGQTALTLRPQTLTCAADAVLCAKGVIKTAAERRGKSATFMPKALSGSPGCGLRINAGLVKDGKSRFFDKRGWAGTSQMLLHFVGGLLAHVDSLLAICAPSANSFARFAAMDEPLYVAFGPSHAATLVAVDSPGEGKPPQLEFRGADLSANPYLAFAALLCAGVDGMLRSIDPISAGFGPLEGDIASGPGASAAPRKAAANLGAALDALEREGAYLSDGDVFGTGLLRRWSEARRAELRALATRPHPYEFAQSYEC